MSKNRNFWDDDDFSGEIDQSVFDESLKGENYADDDFDKYFDESIFNSEMEKKSGKLFDDSAKNFGAEGYEQKYSSKSGYSSNLTSRKPSKDTEPVLDEESTLSRIDIPLDDAEETRKFDLGESVKEKLKEKMATGRRSERTAKRQPAKKKAEAPKKQEEKPMAGKYKKQSGAMHVLAYMLVVICCASLLAAVAWILSVDVLGFTDQNEEVVVTIPKDFTMGEVANILKDNGVIKYKLLFKTFAAISKAKNKISGGTYVLNTNYDYRAIISGMTKSGGKMVEVQVTIPEGYSMKQMFELLEENSVCYASELWEAAQYYNFEYDFLDESDLGQKLRLEGYLFPDTYKFYMNDTATRVISKMLNNFENQFGEEYIARAKELGYSVKQILTVASIIEKEAAGDADRANIASVIYNRLKNTSGPTVGFLQLDSTINYIIAETGESFSTDIDNPYNTYKYKGLPAGPIANPGIKAIKAALYPASTSYYYFAINKQKVTQFFSSYNAFINFTNSSEYGG